jgi:hypothetical protein
MPNRVTVRVTKSFEYEGRCVGVDESLSMLPIDAAVHARRGNVSLTRELKLYRTSDAPVTTTRRRRARKTDAATE